MAFASFFYLLPVLITMIPSWLSIITLDTVLATWIFANIPIFQGVLGGLTLLLITYIVIRMYWIKKLPPKKPLWLMRITIILWIVTIVAGFGVTIIAYVI